MSRQLVMFVATAERMEPIKMTEVHASRPRLTPNQSRAMPPMMGQTDCGGRLVSLGPPIRAIEGYIR